MGAQRPFARGLAGSLDQGVLLEDLAVKTQVDCDRIVSVLPSGSPTHSIPNLLHSPHTSELLRRAREEFDSVLIDTPPMMQISATRGFWDRWRTP